MNNWFPFASFHSCLHPPPRPWKRWLKERRKHSGWNLYCSHNQFQEPRNIFHIIHKINSAKGEALGRVSSPRRALPVEKYSQHIQIALCLVQWQCIYRFSRQPCDPARNFGSCILLIPTSISISISTAYCRFYVATHFIDLLFVMIAPRPSHAKKHEHKRRVFRVAS